MKGFAKASLRAVRSPRRGARSLEARVRKAKIHVRPEQPGDVPLTCADISKTQPLLNYGPTTPLRVGLPRFIEWFHQTRDNA